SGPWSGPWSGPVGRSPATAVLAERFARGEIDEAEYRARLETLLATEQRPQA
ncbi:MAG: SHOCT domain-containing protein, partial [Cellulomonas sp.]|nr:SHOCT domain-containing protein [Cellulomonas sp.]